MFLKAVSRPKIRDIKNLSRKEEDKIGSEIKSSSYVSFSSVGRILGFLFVIVFIFTFSHFNVFAPIFSSVQEAEAQYDAQKAQLEKELEAVEKEIAQWEKAVATTQKQKVTLQNKISELKSKANKLNSQIKSTNLNLQYLDVQIQETTNSITKTTDKVLETKKNLSGLLQNLYQLKQRSLLEILVETHELSEFFDYANALYNLQAKIEEDIDDLYALKATLNTQKVKLADDQESTKNLLAMQLLQESDLQKSKQEQASILETTKGNEARYQMMLVTSRKRASEIRSRIYELIGVKSQVNFGEALDIANWVSSRTGVRTSLLLAVLTQESNLGKNVGTCNRPSDPPSKSWRVIMKPSRDQAPFLQICKELGLDPNSTPVSCPINSPSRGLIAGVNSWGGAMGPAQFIPSTWMGYKDQVTRVTGRSPANPWDIRDAFVACALYLARYGAREQTRAGEWRAAMIYFSGSTNPRYSFYGDSVMAIADKYEKDISYLKEVVTK